MKKFISLFSLMALLLAVTFTPCQAQKKTLNSQSPTKIAQQHAAPAPADVAPAPASVPADAPADVDEGEDPAPSEADASTDSATGTVNDSTQANNWTGLLSYYKKVIGTPEDFNVLLLLAFAFISYLFSFFSAKIPFLKKINSTWERVIVAGIVVGVGFSGLVYQFDLNFMTILEQVAGFVFATKFVHPILDAQGLKTPKPAGAATSSTTA